MADKRHKDGRWELPVSGNLNWTHVEVALLMDIRDELKQLNRTLNCPNFLNMPHDLRRIRINTAKRKRKARARSV